jgi:hypothetical protein
VQRRKKVLFFALRVLHVTDQVQNFTRLAFSFKLPQELESRLPLLFSDPFFLLFDFP